MEVNATLYHLLGYSAAGLKRLTLPEVTHPDEVTETARLWKQLLRGEIPTFSWEKRYLRQGGGIFCASVTASLVRDERGEPLYALAMLEDIGERKRAEEALRASEERLAWSSTTPPTTCSTTTSTCATPGSATRRRRSARRCFWARPIST